MITAVQSCGCPSKYSPPSIYSSPPCTPLSNNSAPYSCSSKVLNRSKTATRQPFENPRQKTPNFSKEDGEKCPCPRPGHQNYDYMQGKCSPCCAGVFPESKIVSKIVEGGKPYKEIEAIINDNHMVIRIQRESLESDWDPPCECVEGNVADGKMIRRLGGGGGGCCADMGSSRCGENVVLQKVDNFVGSGKPMSDDNCRTITVFPEPEILGGEIRDDDNERREKKDRVEQKPAINRAIDMEENPNIFVLRIRKRSENSERKNNIDLEFRTPRPWINKPKAHTPKPVVTSEPPPTTEITVEKKPKKEKGAGKKKKGKKG